MNNKESILKSKKFALYGVYNPEAKGVPKLFFDVYNGNPSINVFPNDPSDSERKPISGKMDPYAWGAFIAACKKIIAGPNGESIYMSNRSGPPKSTFVDSKTVVGKDSDGVIYLSVIKEGRAQKKFKILPAQYHGFVTKDGTAVSDGDASFLFATGFIDTLNSFMIDEMANTYVPPQPRQGGGGGGWGNQNGGGGGQAKSYSNFDNDIPM